MPMFVYAKKIKEYRERKFLTQEKLAKLLGVNYVTVSRCETGSFAPNMAMKKKLVGLFEEAGMKIDEY